LAGGLGGVARADRLPFLLVGVQQRGAGLPVEDRGEFPG